MLSGLLLALSVLGSFAGADARKMMTKSELHARQAEAAKRFERPAPRAASAVKNITFTNPKASRAFTKIPLGCSILTLFSFAEFYVDGAKIPQVDFDVGPSWSGLMPISANANETRKVSVGC